MPPVSVDQNRSEKQPVVFRSPLHRPCLRKEADAPSDMRATRPFGPLNGWGDTGDRSAGRAHMTGNAPDGRSRVRIHGSTDGCERSANRWIGFPVRVPSGLSRQFLPEGPEKRGRNVPGGKRGAGISYGAAIPGKGDARPAEGAMPGRSLFEGLPPEKATTPTSQQSQGCDVVLMVGLEPTR